MRGRSQAAMAATVLAMLALLVPLLSILSSAVVALVTLRNGPKDGLVVGAISALASGVLALLLFGSPAPVVGFLLVLWLPVWALGLMLRNTRSLGLVVQAAMVFGLMMLALFHLQTADAAGQWAELLQPLADGFVQSGMLDQEAGQAFVQLMSLWMSGILAAGFYLQLLLALFLARAWQARLYNPGGFRQEFHRLRMHRLVGLSALPLLAVLLLQGSAAPEWVRELGLLVAPLLFLQGLAVAHALAAAVRHGSLGLVALYVLLFIALPHAQVLVTLVGLADVPLDFRARWGAKRDESP